MEANRFEIFVASLHLNMEDQHDALALHQDFLRLDEAMIAFCQKRDYPLARTLRVVSSAAAMHLFVMNETLKENM